MEIIVENDEGDSNDSTIIIKESDPDDVKHKKFRLRRCGICKLEFNSLKELNIHKRTAKHQYKKKCYICSYCNKEFSTSDHLNRHIRSHTKEKPYCCDFCGMCFAVVQNLRRHEKLHTGERPYKCDVCGKGKQLFIFINVQ